MVRASRDQFTSAHTGRDEDIRTAAHSPKGDESHPRHSVEDERMCNTVEHIPIG